MLRTAIDGKSLLHRELWQVVQLQIRQGNQMEVGYFYYDLTAMVFAFHTVEAYLNYLGEYLAPQIWQDERNYFRNEPYRGFNGKLRKILELIDYPWRDPAPYPIDKILELKELRDLIAHARPEHHTETVNHPDGTEPPIIISRLHSMVNPEARNQTLLAVEKLLEDIHSKAIPIISEQSFARYALSGPTQYIFRTTSKES
jgi:hypothetical protein